VIYRHRIRRLTVSLLVLSGIGSGLALADWDMSPPNDPARQWHIGVSTTVGYDNNINTASTNRQSSSTYAWAPSLSINLPGDQTSAQLRYQYTATYYPERPDALENPDQSHVLNATVNHVFTTRLSASLSESYTYGIEPALVGPIIEREQGDYNYNLVTATLSYQLTGRWTLSLNQTWDFWLYNEENFAIGNNHNDFGTTVSASYVVNPRTTVAMNYSYSVASYNFASVTNIVRDSQSQALYLSATYHFKPLVFLQASLGAQLDGFGDGSGSQASPYASLSATYNFGAKSVASAGFNYNIQLSEVASYRDSVDASFFVSVSHDFTPKLTATLSYNYVIASYESLNPIDRNPFDLTQTSSVEEDTMQLYLTATYTLNNWAGLIAEYTYQDVASGFDNRITGVQRSFDRMHGDIGLRLSY
jgi:hypothetical protein